MDASDTTTKNIVREIYRECMNMGLIVEENLILYCVKLLRLDPNWGISDKLLNRINVQRFVQYWVNKVKDQKQPSTVTLKMQNLYDSNLNSFLAIISSNKAGLLSKLDLLKNEILETTAILPEDVEKFYKKVTYHVTLASGLGNPVQTSVYKEARAALQSVFFESDIKDFLTYGRTQKSAELESLKHLVSGVRLYNKDCKKGGEGIANLYAILNQASAALKMDLQKVLSYVMDRVNILTTAVDNCFVVKESELGAKYYVVCEPPPGVKKEEVNTIKDLLLLYRQYELFVRRLMHEVSSLELRFEDIYEQFKKALLKIHTTIQFRTAIPTFQVYPLFTKVANIWYSMQDETVILARMNRVLIELQSLVVEAPWLEQQLDICVGDEGPLTDAERLDKTMGGYIASDHPGLKVIDPRCVKSMLNYEYQFLGFCPWMLVQTKGGLIPGNPHLGAALIHKRYYVFSSLQAFNAFAVDPQRGIMQVLTLARNNPELINFIKVLDQLKAVQDVGQLFVKPARIIVTYNVEQQTELHPIGTKIDKNYKWNIWDWKRDALKLADLTHCQTKSVQTMNSKHRNTIRTQTEDPRDKNLQTKKDNYSNVPTLSNFIFGLRGRKDDKQFVIELTGPVDE